jgi:hypothetical protein
MSEGNGVKHLRKRLGSNDLYLGKDKSDADYEKTGYKKATMHNGYFRKLKYTFFSGNTTASRRIVRSFGRKRTAQYGSKRPDNCNFAFISIRYPYTGKNLSGKYSTPRPIKIHSFVTAFPSPLKNEPTLITI